MDFEYTHLGEASEGFGGGKGDVGLGLGGVLVEHHNGVDAGREHVIHVLLVEARFAGAVGAPDEREGAIGDVRKHMGGDGPVEVGELLFGELGERIEDFLRVG